MNSPPLIWRWALAPFMQTSEKCARDVMSLFPQWDKGNNRGECLCHIIFPLRGTPAAYSCLMATSCHKTSQPAATQERQML